ACGLRLRRTERGARWGSVEVARRGPGHGDDGRLLDRGRVGRTARDAVLQLRANRRRRASGSCPVGDPTGETAPSENAVARRGAEQATSSFRATPSRARAVVTRSGADGSRRLSLKL